MLERDIIQSGLNRRIQRTALEHLEEGNAVCHFDLHVDNILYAQDRFLVIDWANALQGSPLTDVAKTIILHNIGSLPVKRLKKYTEIPMRNIISHFYTWAYIKKTRVKLEEIHRWLLPVAISRLQQRIEGEEKALHYLIHQQMKSLS